jgi:hypothetical protein
MNVIQAFFPERKPPGGISARRFARASLDIRLQAAHPAAAAQRSGSRLPPHPAKVAKQPVHGLHAAALQPKTNVLAFRAPRGFLEAQKCGEPLPKTLLRQMEGYFDTDFSDVRVHVGGEAASIGALAFTVGTDLYFAPGQYQPHTQNGRELIGHELTHVVQQREGRVGNPFDGGVAVVHDEELEAEADRHGRAAAQAKLSSAPREFRQVRGPSSGYQLVIGAYLNDSDRPEALAGHSFVAIDSPDGERRAFGFSPAHYGSYDPKRDLARLKAGVTGIVHDDSAAFDRPGVKTRAYPISPEQARAAMAKVSEYQSGRYRYSADRRQCATFVTDVLSAAGVPNQPLPEPPRIFYEALDDEP